MCGISGFNWKDEERIKIMVSSLSYRGPDARGIFVDDIISLGHNRLSVIDLSLSANQPMPDNSGELTIVFNGEIYNFLEIKQELKGEYEFKTKSDTEVLLAGYRKWGKAMVQRLNGMFAFAIWDQRTNSLFCARDHAGMKPFYYFWDGKKFIFASEIRGILNAHNLPRKLNLEALNHYFRVLYTPEPMTMVENIYKLPPSHTLILKNGSISIEAYGQDSLHTIHLPYHEATSLLRGKVLESVKRHLIADVPVGIYLSGGIDSNIVLFSMSNFRRDIKTFSVGFDLGDREKEKKFNRDLELAKKTAKFFRAEHNYILVSANDAVNSFEEMMMHNSDPISNPTSIAMLLLGKFTKSQVSVALTGNAGDELFGGYDRYRMALAAYYYKMLPNFVRIVGNKYVRISRLDYENKIDLFAQFMFEKDDKLSQVISPSIFMSDLITKKYFQSRYLLDCSDNPAECFMKVDQKSWLPDHFFMLSDKMSMASALEERMPLADKELLVFSGSIPRSYKLNLFRTKKIIKDAFKNDLPDFLLNQPKRGWFSPGAKWLRDPNFLEFTKEILSPGYYKNTQPLFNWPSVQNMLERHVNKKEYNLIILWAILTFQAWARQYQIEI